jgi:hypothetical protein
MIVPPVRWRGRRTNSRADYDIYVILFARADAQVLEMISNSAAEPLRPFEPDLTNVGTRRKITRQLFRVSVQAPIVLGARENRYLLRVASQAIELQMMRWYSPRTLATV